LIFYQQGLSGSEVLERANTVVKLAQVTRETTEDVSSQMTAIWNNFADGSKSLEYYADALTKLGAATAASTDEISKGLSEFAAIADTVGLSYEYASAGVATVVDKTRQSAETVGNAFKTVFARIQGLSLGETLEDGVTLNKYSEALAKVGVNILDNNGHLKEMDDILDHLGDRWNLIGQETQVALAQTVGGARQYAQFIALMDNWKDVKKNIELASEAQGELNAQQEIWAESVEGSQQKLTNAKDLLSEDLISDDMIIAFNNGLADLIKGIDRVVDAAGGLMPIATMLIMTFSRQLFPILTNGF
jgi:TP901 family phage tail tape measure protein